METFSSGKSHLPGARDRIHRAMLRHMGLIGVFAVCSIVAFIALIGRHPSLATVVVSPLVVFGVILLIVSVPAVRHLESMGNEATQEYVLETGRDVSGMSRREKRAEVRHWKHRVRHPRALRLYGILFITFGFIAMLAARQWTGAVIVGAAALLIVVPTRRPDRPE